MIGPLKIRNSSSPVSLPPYLPNFLYYWLTDACIDSKIDEEPETEFNIRYLLYICRISWAEN
jgi:hypothetical protein